MTRDEMLALAERVERAEGADRELDRAVLVALGTHVLEKRGADRKAWWYSRAQHGIQFSRYSDDGVSFGYPPPFPNYTASLDAALSLVPEGAGFNLDRYWIRDGVRWRATVSTGGVPSDPRKVYEVWDAYSAATATAAVALTARAAQLGQEGEG